MRSFKVTLEVTNCDTCPWSSYDHVLDLSRCVHVFNTDESIRLYSENFQELTDSCPVAHLHEEL